jgi:hypothetical protein
MARFGQWAQRQMTWINRIDPAYQFLYFVVFKQLFKPRKPLPGEYYLLEASETDFLYENLAKHRQILWLNLLLVLYLMLYGIDSIRRAGDPAVVISGLLAPAMVTGTAWYTVSFGGIPTQFSSIAIVLTRYMFLAFSLSMTLLTALLCAITNPILSIFVLIPVYVSLFIASILYDTMDGLKIGLDSTLLKMSRAHLNYYRKLGYLTPQETEVEIYDKQGGVGDDDATIATFSYSVATLDDSLKVLSGPKRALPIANHMIATATDTLCKLATLPLTIDQRSAFESRRSERFQHEVAAIGRRVPTASTVEDYIYRAHELDLIEADRLTVVQLQEVVAELQRILPLAAQDELRRIDRTLSEFSKMRQIDTENSANPTDPDVTEPERDQKQEFADYLFAQSFQQLSTLIKSYRHIFITSTVVPAGEVPKMQ